MAFEAGGELYKFKRMPLGITNRIASFQRILDEIIKKEDLKETFTYIGDMTICGIDKREHDTNFARFK